MLRREAKKNNQRFSLLSTPFRQASYVYFRIRQSIDNLSIYIHRFAQTPCQIPTLNVKQCGTLKTSHPSLDHPKALRPEDVEKCLDVREDDDAGLVKSVLVKYRARSYREVQWLPYARVFEAKRALLTNLEKRLQVGARFLFFF